MKTLDFGKSDVVCFDTSNSLTSGKDKCSIPIFATRDSRQLSKIKGPRAIIVTHVRDPKDAKQLRIGADFIIYEITQKTTEKELRRIIDNRLCDMLLGAEQLFSNPGLHFQKIHFNHVIAKICAEQNISVLLNLRPLLFHEKISSSMIRLVSERIKFIAQMCDKHETSYFGVTMAENELESRNPADLESFISTIVRAPHNL